jgi:glutathione S-transferase
MIRLHQFQRAWGLPNASPFCMKVETHLRMAGVPYESVLVTNPGKLPKGKAPVLEDDGRLIPDSTFIVKYLDEKHGSLDARLSAAERAVAHAFARMLEERFYWATVYSRWVDERGWEIVRRDYFGALPPVVRTAVPWMVQRKVKASLRGHGIGLHDALEIYGLGCEDIASVATFLAGKPYFMGDEPTGIDAVVYAAMANTLWAPIPSPLKDAAMKYPALEAYCQRMRARYYPEPKIGKSWSPG